MNLTSERATGATTGWARLWIDGVLVEGDMWSVFDPDELTYSGEDLSCAYVLVGIMSGNNPNNPAHTFSWSDLKVTGYTCVAWPPVGGIWIPINKFGLLAPWIGLASLITVAAVSVVYVSARA